MALDTSYEEWGFVVPFATIRPMTIRRADASDAAALARGAGALWLGVWERNFRTQAFYRKCGFVDVGEHVFLFGKDPQTDHVMEARLS